MNNETLADIIDEMRNRAARREISPEVYGLADRIEAAAEREARIREDAATESAFKRGEEIHAQHCANCAAREPGNAAALRAALEDTEELLEHFAKPGTMLHGTFFLHMRDNRAALAAPPRNCDVGTPETQVVRMAAYCRSHQDTEVTLCKRCPIKCDNWFLCALRWAQMPYEEGGAECQR